MLEFITLHSSILILLLAWFLDLALGDPTWLPHPVVGFGKAISFGEHHLNKGQHRMLKGAIMTIVLILITFIATAAIRYFLYILPLPYGGGMGVRILFDVLIIFYCLAGTTLIREVRQVFLSLDESLEAGRRQVARIVGRDTSQLSAQEVRTAALETLAENLSDGVIAPLFWLAVGGVPAMLTYKMINTLDSMIGYRTERYKSFGCWAARIDDIANFIPARLTALLMVLVSGRWTLLTFVIRNGRKHASPNSGYPEAALAGILNCRFGGPHTYFGEVVEKPYIGENDRMLTTQDMKKAVRINRLAEVLAIVLVIARYCL